MFSLVKQSAAPRIAETFTLPSPIGGLNDRDSLIGMAPTECLRAENFICRPYGIAVRNGYTEWATGLGTGTVDTLMSYFPATGSPVVTSQPPAYYDAFTINPERAAQTRLVSVPSGTKVFAACDGSVFDVSLGGTGPWTPEATISGEYFSWANFQNIAGNFLLTCRDTGGYFYYDGATWVQPTFGPGVGQIDGCDPALFTFVFMWKRRVWFIEKDTGRAWYLPVGQLTGTVSPWNFGEQFKRGGNLLVLANWTLDAGVGVDDYMAAFSSQGDVVIYQGFDPDNAPTDFSLRGVWYVGPLPNSNRCVDDYGGDLLVASASGVRKLSDIVRFGDTQQAQVSETSKVNSTFSQFVRDYKSLKGWQIKSLSGISLTVFVTPYDATGRYTMLVQDEVTRGWSVLYEHPCTTMLNHNGEYFAGTIDGRVVSAFNGPLDNIQLSAPEFDLIAARVTPAYSALGKPGLDKNATMIRLAMLGVRTPSIRVTPLANYALEQEPYSPSIPPPAADAALWDAGIWDASLWGGNGRPLTLWVGCAAEGFALTAQLDFTAYGGLTLNQYDWLFTTGGPLS